MAVVCALGAVPATARASSVSMKVTTDPRIGTSAVLTYTAAAGELNNVSVSWDGVKGQILVVDSGALVRPTPLLSSGCQMVGVHKAACPIGAATNVTLLVDAGDMADTVDVRQREGAVWQARLFGGGGDDRLTTDAYFISFTPGLGRDDMTAIGAASPTYYYGDHPGPVTLSVDGIANDGMPGEGDNIRAVTDPAATVAMVGTAFADTFIGSAGNEWVQGGPGDDLADLQDGHDHGFGEDGADRLDGGSGGDELSGGNGADRVAGGSGNDYLDGDEGDDEVWGDSGDDYITLAYGATYGLGVDLGHCGDGEDRVRTDPLDVVDADCELIN
jgi:Ca2+-binding RTX toxin-like protein